MIIEGGRGGAIVMTSSTAGLVGDLGLDAGSVAYTASRHAVAGLMRQYANGLGHLNIRVNSVYPAEVDTPRINNEHTQGRVGRRDYSKRAYRNLLPVSLLDADISEAVAWLVGDAARYVTGVVLPGRRGFHELAGLELVAREEPRREWWTSRRRSESSYRPTATRRPCR